jgi:hypothetical protein
VSDYGLTILSDALPSIRTGGPAQDELTLLDPRNERALVVSQNSEPTASVLPDDHPTVRVFPSVSFRERLNTLQTIQQARRWWRDHRGDILASVEKVLNIAEKGLDGLPVYGPKAAIAVAAEAMRALRVCFL